MFSFASLFIEHKLALIYHAHHLPGGHQRMFSSHDQIFFIPFQDTAQIDSFRGDKSSALIIPKRKCFNCSDVKAFDFHLNPFFLSFSLHITSTDYMKCAAELNGQAWRRISSRELQKKENGKKCSDFRISRSLSFLAILLFILST